MFKAGSVRRRDQIFDEAIMRIAFFRGGLELPLSLSGSDMCWPLAYIWCWSGSPTWPLSGWVRRFRSEWAWSLGSGQVSKRGFGVLATID